MSTSDVQLHFCDLCSESIPQGEIDGARAVRLRDKWICAACCALAPRSEETPTPLASASSPLPARSRSSLAVVGLIVSAAAAIVVAILAAQTTRQVRAMRSLVARLESEHVQRAQHIERTLGRLEVAKLQRSEEDPSRVPDAVTGLGAGEPQDGLARVIVDLRNKLEDDSIVQSEALSGLRSRLQALEARATLQSVTGAAPAAPFDPPPPDEMSPERQALLASLRSVEPTLRARALIDVSANRDPRDTPFIAAMLRDGDPYVRVTAVRHLERVLAKDAIGPLIDVLEDPDSTTRMAADSALRGLTGQRCLFDPWGPPKDRAAGVAEWRAWWSTHWRSFVLDAPSGR